MTDIGANDTKGCFFLHNASTDSKGTKAYFETPFYDLFDNSKPSMSFYYSYAKNAATQADTFRLEYTLDCGKTWRIFPGIPGTTTMANLTGGVTSSAYFPNGPEQWRKLTLTSSFQALFKNKNSVKFRFYFGGDSQSSGENNFFIDEININNETISALQDQTIQNVDIYPNPSTAGVNIDVEGTDVSSFQIEIGDLTGHSVYKINF